MWGACCRAVRASCLAAAPCWQTLAAAKARADGSSCQQLVCGRETVCQRDRSILKSPVTLACPHIQPAHFPRLAGPPEPVRLSRSVRDSRALSGGPSADRKMPVRALIVNPQWPAGFHRVRPACPGPAISAGTLLEIQAGSIPPRRYPFVNHIGEGLPERASHDGGQFPVTKPKGEHPGPSLPAVCIRSPAQHGSNSIRSFRYLRVFIEIIIRRA